MHRLADSQGSEEKEGQVYHNGNKEPQGFGHICFSVDNISGACQALEANGVKFQKKQKDGRQKDIAFALDPDNCEALGSLYFFWILTVSPDWIELIGHGKDEPSAKSEITSYRFNHTMIRVKDPAKSLKFYRDILGMQLVRKAEMKEAEFDLYFLSFPKKLPSGHALVSTEKSGVNPLAEGEGILELTHNYGSEEKEGQVYHNGNDEPQGFGHIAISVDDIDAACQRFEDEGVTFKKKLSDGKMHSIAFILDPDNYWIEVISNETLKKKVT